MLMGCPPYQFEHTHFGKTIVLFHHRCMVFFNTLWCIKLLQKYICYLYKIIDLYIHFNVGHLKNVTVNWMYGIWITKDLENVT